MCLRKKKRTKLSPQSKVLWIDLKSFALSIGLFLAAWLLITLSFYCDGWHQNLLLGLGTGAATSAIVSYVFYSNDKQAKKREALLNRIKFMKDFKIIYYNILYLIDFDRQIDKQIDLDTFIKNQHRWFHDYYKKMVAGSECTDETALRINQIEQFMIAISVRIPPCFEYNMAWKQSDFSEWQARELNNFYVGIKTIEIYLKQKRYQDAFCEFAYVLETLKRMPSEFVELESFKLIDFIYKPNSELTMQLSKFECKEPFFKAAREFQKIRHNNYKKFFSEKSQNNKYSQQ